MRSRRAYISRSELSERPPEEGSRRWLVAELDKYTSIIVRRRDRRCVTCGSRQALQCSHFYSRRYLSIRFSLVNCNAMCPRCNRRHNCDRRPYEEYMLKTYGPSALAELNALRAAGDKVADDELRETLDKYRAMA